MNQKSDKMLDDPEIK